LKELLYGGEKMREPSLDLESITLDNKTPERRKGHQKNPTGYVSVDIGECSEDQETFAKHKPHAE